MRSLSAAQTFVPRGRHLFVFDLGAILISILGAFALRFDASNIVANIRPYLPVALIPLVVQPLANIAFGLYRREWRYASVREMFGVVGAVGTATIVSAVVFALLSVAGAPGTVGMPRSFFPLEGILCLLLVGGGRFTLRWLLENSGRSGGTDEEIGVRTLVYGAGEAGAAVTRMGARDRSLGMQIVGYLDDDPQKKGSRLHGRRIMGPLSVMPDARRRTGAQQLVVAMPSAPGSVVREAVEAGLKLGLVVRIVPSLDELLGDADRVTRIRPVRLEDLLRREPAGSHSEELAEYLNGTSVLVTGGGGSIGVELARQILALGPRELTIVDQSEVGLWAAERDLSERLGPEGPQLHGVLADVRSENTVARVIEAAEPDVVFHAAALKHVPICELQPSEAVLTNVFGTANVLAACERIGVGRFVLISTDKAVQPIGIMGATKRLAELLTVDAATRLDRPFMAVRFGNVLGSSGSVVPVFQRQLERGLPLTITHPDATRYFMTIPEAVTLILEAGAESTPGQIYLLDMGDPVRILDLAVDMIRLSGADPESVSIVYTGLRPGERMHETLLFDHESVQPTAHDRVWRTRSSSHPAMVRPLDEVLEDLKRATSRDDNRRTREILTRSGILHAPPETATLAGVEAMG